MSFDVNTLKIKKDSYPDVSSHIETIAAIWSEVLLLPREEIDQDYSFIQHGGSSLLAYRAVELITRQFSVGLPITELLGSASLLEVATRVSELEEQDFSHEEDALDIKTLSPHPSYLSYSQRGQLYICELQETVKPFVLVSCLYVRGIDSSELVERSLRTLIDSNDSFWLEIDYNKGEAVQRVCPRTPWDIIYADFNGEINARQKARNHVLEKMDHELNLFRAPSFLAHICRTGPKEYAVFLGLPHLFFDAWSVETLFFEFTRIFSEFLTDNGKSKYSPSTLPTIDIAVIEKRYLESSTFEVDQRYWLDTMQGANHTTIKRYMKETKKPTLHGDLLRKNIPSQVRKKLGILAREYECSLYTLLLSACYIVLHRVSALNDITIGAPFANRERLVNNDNNGYISQKNSINGIGCLVNLVPLRAILNKQDHVSDVLKHVQDILNAALVHQAYPYEKMVAEIGGKERNTLSPLFDVVVTYWAASKETIGKTNPISFEREDLYLPYSKYPVEFIFNEDNGNMTLDVRYAIDLLDTHVVESLTDAILTVLERIPSAIEEPISCISFVSEEERQHLIELDDRVDVHWPETETLTSLFTRQVAQTPESIAVTCDSDDWSYRKLAARAADISVALQKKGVKRGDRIGLLLRREPEMIAAIFGILQVGAAYVPIDPNHPNERKAYIAQDAECKLVLTQENIHAPKIDTTSLRIEEIPHGIGVGIDFNERPSPDDLSYIIYTSGTTGQPKGVMIEHRHVVRILFNNEFPFPFTTDDVWSMYHSHCFDVSVWEIFGSQLTGGRLVMISNLMMRDPALFRKTLVREKVTVLSQTPTAFYNLLLEESLHQSTDLFLKYVLFAGEALDLRKLRDWARKYPQCKLCNLYGTTETTIHATLREITPEDLADGKSVIGVPLPTLALYLVDQYMNPVPVGFIGELLIGGKGVSRGYYNKPELTAERFIDNPFRPGEKAYRSGDLAMRLPDGRLVYIGRNDHQVQIRGHRIEPDEIAENIRQIDGVLDALAIPIEEDDGNFGLCAYWIGTENDASELRTALTTKLPFYMIPSYFEKLDVFPTTVNGKIDIKQLPKPQKFSKKQSVRVLPRNAREEEFYKVLATVLETEDFGITDDFFDLGGDSLKAVKAAVLSDRAFQVIDLYQHRTIEALAIHATRKNRLVIGPLNGERNAKEYNMLLTVPYGGGNPANFVSFAESFHEAAPDWHTYSINLPGKSGGRYKDVQPNIETVATLAVEEISRLDPAPGSIAVMGYCVGIAMALELIQALRRKGLNVSAAIMAGIIPPVYDTECPPILDPWKNTTNEELIASLVDLGFKAKDNDIPSELIEDFREDVRLYRQYFYARQQASYEPLDIPSFLVFGDMDSETNKNTEKFTLWHNFFDSSLSTKHSIPGAGHYFIFTHREILSSALSNWLQYTHKNK